MPLHAHQERVGVGGFHGLDQSVLGMCCHPQSSAQTLDGLAVQAVYQATALKRFRKR
jgi:hypothetical protein